MSDFVDEEAEVSDRTSSEDEGGSGSGSDTSERRLVNKKKKGKEKKKRKIVDFDDEDEEDEGIWAATRENLSSGFPTKRDSNQPPQLERLARKLKIRF